MSYLTDCIVKISVIMGIALIATRLLRRQSAAMRHFTLMTSVLIGLLLPIAALVLPEWHWSPSITVPAPTPARSLDATTSYADSAVAATRISDTRVSQFSVSAGAKIVWIMGLLSSMAAMVVGSFRLVRVAVAAEPLNNWTWNQLSEAIHRQYRLRRSVELLQSPNPSILLTWGIRKPKVIVPAGAESWHPDRIRVVLGHELAHVRRLDWLAHVVTECFRAIYWFHPLVWMVCNRLRLESEHACDNVAMTCGISGTDYAAQLLDLARDLNTSERAWSSALAMARPSTIERRFEAMLNQSVNRQPIRPVHLGLITIMGILLSVPVATFSSSAKPPKVTATHEAQPAAIIQSVAPVPYAVPAAPTTTTERPRQPAAVPGEQQPGRYTGELITVRLKDADIRDFFKFLADFTGKNFVVDSDVQGQLTLTLNSIPWDQALDVVLKDHGLALVQEPSLVRIGATASTPASVLGMEQASGRLTGTVFDASTLPTPGAQVRLTSPALTDGRAAITSSDGRYSFDNLPSGDYRIAISLAGFKNLNVDAVNVSGLGQTTVNLRLDVALLSEEITITSSVSARSPAPQLGPPPSCSPLLPAASATPGIGGAVQQAMLISHTTPIYPQQAHDERVQGLVVIEAVIGTDGHVTNIKPITGHPLLAPAVSTALSQWCYRPTLLNGVPVESPVDVTVMFRLVN